MIPEWGYVILAWGHVILARGHVILAGGLRLVSQTRPLYTKGVWKQPFCFEKASNVSVHTASDDIKYANHRSFWILCLRIVTTSLSKFLKSSVSKLLSVLWFEKRFWKAPFSWQTRSQSFLPLDQRSENEISGSIHFEITIGNTCNRILVVRFTAQSQSASMACYGACLKWLLPELSFSDRWSRGTKLWERDCFSWRISVDGTPNRRNTKLRFHAPLA